MDCLVLMDYL